MKNNNCRVNFVMLIACIALTHDAAANPLEQVNAAIERYMLAANVDVGQTTEVRAGDQDTDGDFIPDRLDNCIAVFNDDQRDTDGDGLGNICDADLNQDCVVNVVDLGILRTVFFTDDANADFDGNGVVNVIDLAILRTIFFAPPGPSGVPNVCSEMLTLEGVVAAATLPGGTVTALVDGSPSGGDVASYTTGINPDGSFSVDISRIVDTDFVTLQASGGAANRLAKLQSFAGTVGQLADLGGDDGSVNSAEANSLLISPVSTAVSVLAQERSSDPILTDDALADNAGAIDTALMIDMATLAKLYVDNPSITLGGLADILVVLEDPELRAAFLEIFVNNGAPLFPDAATMLSNELRTPYVDGATPAVIIAVNARNLGRIVATDMRFAADGTVDYSNLGDRATGNWSLDANGQIIVDFAAPILTGESFLFIENPDMPGEFVEALQQKFLDQLVVDRLVDGVRSDIVFVRNTERTVFPDYPSIPADIISAASSRQNALLAFSQTRPFELSAAELGGASYTTTFFHSDHMSQGLNDIRQGADTLDFNSDGTGSTRRSGFAFTWTVSPEAGLNVTFANGDESRFQLLFDDFDGLPTVLVTSTLAGVDQFSARSLLLEREASANFTLADLENRRFRSTIGAGATTDSPLTIFDFMFAPDGTACRAPGSASSNWAYSVTNGRLELVRSFVNSPDNFFYRSLQPIQTRADGFWGIETLQVALQEPQVDAAVTPGRINFYSIEQELVGNLRPTFVDDSLVVPEGTNLVVYFSTLLANDVDPEGDELLPKGIDFVSANGGVLSEFYSNAGELIGLLYEPPAGLTGSDTFQYRASDLFCYDEPGIAGNVELIFTP